MDPPTISVGKGAIIQILPTLLRFWEKLGLTPRMGKKDVTAFLFFRGQRPKQPTVCGNLVEVHKTYSVRSLNDPRTFS